MTFKLIFWVMMLLWFLSLIWPAFGRGDLPHGTHINGVFAFILFLLLGWRVYGAPISG